MRNLLIAALIVCAAGISLKAAEEVKLLSSFEAADFAKWNWKEIDGDWVYRDSSGSVVIAAKGEASDGEWALTKRVKTKSVLTWINSGELSERLRFLHGSFMAWPKRFGQWIDTDWSGYDRLRVDVKSTASDAVMRIVIYDQIALPPIDRVYRIPSNEWVTLEVNLAEAAKVHEMALSPENQKIYGVKSAKVRMFNPAQVANFIVMSIGLEQLSDLYMDNLRLLKTADSEKARFKVFVDESPFPTPHELLPSAPKPVVATVKPKVVDPVPAEILTYDISKERRIGAGPLGPLVFRAATAVDTDRMIFTQTDYTPKVTYDGGKTWESLGELRHSRFAPGLSIGADGNDLIGTYVAVCGGGSKPTDIFYREVKFDGTKWVAGDPQLCDVDSWHCPEYRVDVLRLKSGRIWSAWFQSSRVYDFYLKARYSDDGGHTWRDHDSNGMYTYTKRNGREGNFPIGVTWWWEEPAITPSKESANGRVGLVAINTSLKIVPYGDHVAAMWGQHKNTMVWSYFDGKVWSEPIGFNNKFVGLASATTLGEYEINVVAGDTILRLTEEKKWVEDAPATQVPLLLTDAGNTLVCIGRRDEEIDGKKVTLLWSSQRKAGGQWSEPDIFAREPVSSYEGKTIMISAPRSVSQNFVPVFWAPDGNPQWVRYYRLVIKK